MELASLLNITRGVTAVIGGGGKTTLLNRLAEELREQGSVILCTSTKVYPPTIWKTLLDPTEEEIRRALTHRVLCIGAKAAEGKLAAPGQSFGTLTELADFVLVEADGSKHLPLKAHGSHEPVIPPEASQVIYVLGADGFGRPIQDVCHRPALYSALCGAPEEAMVTPALAARVLNAEGLGDRVYVNKVESMQDRENAALLAELLDCPVTAGSLHKGEYFCLH